MIPFLYLSFHKLWRIQFTRCHCVISIENVLSVFFPFIFCTLLTTGIYKRFFLFSFFTSSFGFADDIQIVNPESFDLLIGKLWNMLKSFKENWYFHFFYSFEWFFFAFFKDWIKVKWFLCFSFDEVNKRSQVAYKIRYLNKFMSTEQRSTSTKFWNK